MEQHLRCVASCKWFQWEYFFSPFVFFDGSFFGWEYNNEKPGLIHFNYVVGFAKMKVGRMFNFARWPRLKVGAVKGNRNWKSWKYKSTDKGAHLCKRRQSCGENSVTWERWWESFFGRESWWDGETVRKKAGKGDKEKKLSQKSPVINNNGDDGDDNCVMNRWWWH